MVFSKAIAVLFISQTILQCSAQQKMHMSPAQLSMAGHSAMAMLKHLSELKKQRTQGGGGGKNMMRGSLKDIMSQMGGMHGGMAGMRGMQGGMPGGMPVMMEGGMPGMGGGIFPGGNSETGGHGPIYERMPGMETFDSGLGAPGAPAGAWAMPATAGKPAVPPGLQAMFKGGGHAAGSKAKPLSPLQMVEEVGKGCKDLPASIREEFKQPQCYLHANEFFQITKWLVSSFMRMQTTHKFEFPKEFKAKVHEVSDRACGNPQCQPLAEKVMEHAFSCEIAAICAVESKMMPLHICKMVLGGMIKQAMSQQMSMMCEVETNTKTYCEEVALDIISNHMDCWVQIHTPVGPGCSPKCVKVWSEVKSKYPHCAHQFASSSVKMMSVMSGITQKMGMGGMNMGVVRSADEICADLSGVQQLAQQTINV
eukprot:TRINITY_DN20362_c1_g1_i1.p1 TRINITY_DN20362_c1_g1~~TRINITY_DN20362_c1_g1_i1.p1  ORF type:complete len:423 (+),score=71.06 TRINITY_DN20362_c1_g1_i1:65-1333(+)